MLPCLTFVVERVECFQENGKITKRQSGVIRTNCVDCLDRTNVFQGVLGRKSLDDFLKDIGYMSAGASFATAFPAVRFIHEFVSSDLVTSLEFKNILLCLRR